MNPNAIGLYRVKNEERWIEESLRRTLKVVRKVIVFDDHSTDRTRDVARSLNGVKVIESPFEGIDEARDKEHLLRLTIKEENPRWIVFLDGDEVFTKRAIEEVRAIVAGNRGGIVRFRIVYLWDNPQQERCDGAFGRMFQPRLFSLFDQNVSRLFYRSAGFGGNLHCGQVPKGYVGKQWRARFEIKHYGYLHPADRVRKYE